MKQYSKRTAIMHWLIFTLIAAAFYLGHELHESKDAAWKLSTYPLHFILGDLVFLLTLLRLYFRKKDGEPAPANVCPLLNKVAAATHVLLNLTALSVAVSGFITVVTSGLIHAFEKKDPALIPDFHKVPAKEFHEFFLTVLALLVTLHVLAALYHQFALKDRLLRRIMVRRFED